jgi:RimJ/RimL family protein N-acetyltransferase
MPVDPTLHTDRLVLAPHGLADFDDLSVLWADPQVTRFLGGHPASEEESWARLMRYAGSWALLGYGFWAIRRRSDGQYLGNAGYLDGRRSGVGSFGGDPEIGWSLAIAAQGQGYAGEAVAAALRWGRGRFRRAVAMIHADNAASTKVAARAGFNKFAHARYKDEPMGLWEHRFPRD